MDEDGAWRRVAAARVAHLATVRPDGRPDVVPCCFALADDGRLFTAVDGKPKSTRRLQRLANVRARPDVTVLVDAYDEDWARLWWVRVRGVARVVPDGDPAVALALGLLAAKYPQYRAAPPAGPVLEVTAGAIRWWTGSGG